MQIGSRGVGRPGIREYSQASGDPLAFGAGVAEAVRGLGAELGVTGEAAADIGLMVQEYEKKKKAAQFDIDFIRWQGQESRRVLDATGNMEPGAAGLTNNIDASIGASYEEFAKRTGIADDPEMDAIYRERFEQYRQGTVTDVFRVEFDESNRFLGDQIVELIGEGREVIRTNPQAFDAEFSELSAIIDKSPLPPTTKEELKKQAYNDLTAQVFDAELTRAQLDQAPVREPDGTDVVAPGLSPAARATLNTIAGPESGGVYNVIYGGAEGNKYFDDYSDHPRIYSQRPDGRWSSAAGRYQFVASTWDETVAEMNALGYNITDFSPVNQDRVAWYLAQKVYRGRTGRELEADMASGDREIIKGIRVALSGTWEGFENMSNDAFANVAMGGRGLQGGGTGHSQVPDIWNDERFAGLSFDTKQTLAGEATIRIAKQREAEATARYTAQDQLTESLLTSLRNGENGAERAALDAIASGVISDSVLVGKLDKYVGEAQKETVSASTFQTKLVSGQPITPEDQGGFDAYVKRSGLAASLASGDGEAARVYAGLVERTGLMSPAVTNTLLAQMRGTDGAGQKFAVGLLADMYNRNPRSFAGLDKEVQTSAALAATLATYQPNSAALMEHFNLLQSPQGASVRKAYMEQADTLLQEQGLDDFFQNATTWWARNLGGAGIPAAELPESPDSAMKFTSDYQTLFKQNYALFMGDETAAHDATSKMMAQVWAPSPMTGGLMENSPLAPGFNVQPFDGSFEWISDHVREVVGASDVSIVSDAQTVLDSQRLGYPTYRAIVRDEFGQISIAPERVGIYITPERQAEYDARMRVEAADALYDRAVEAGLQGDAETARKLEEKWKSEKKAAVRDYNATVVPKESQRMEIESRLFDLQVREQAERESGLPRPQTLKMIEEERQMLQEMLEELGG